MSIRLIILIFFIVSLIKTIELISLHLSKNRALTEKGYKLFGLYATLLIVSTLQLFNVFDFVGYIFK